MARESRSRFRHEDVSSVPSGWRVRTISHGRHRVRVAFPKGRRQKGAGRLISILHPRGENPCGLRSTNPAELMVMGANPPRSRNRMGFRVVAIARLSANQPTFTSPIFLTRAEADQALEHIDPEEFFRPHIQRVPLPEEPESSPAAPNPRVEVVHGSNPPVEEIVEEFTGEPAEWIDVYNEPHMPRGRYAQLGQLLNLYIKPLAGGQVQKITFGEGDQAPLVVTDRTARQIYFVAGNQDISDSLGAFGGRDRGDGKIELGQSRRIDYKSRKEHVAAPDEDRWKHEHGEEDGLLPTVLFDAANKRLLYEGGEYRIEGPWIKN